MRLLLALASMFLAVACAPVPPTIPVHTTGTKFEMSDVEAMQPGITTYEEAKSKLGQPDSERFGADGSTSAAWIWVQTGSTAQMQSRAVRILFDKNKKMVRVEARSGK